MNIVDSGFLNLNQKNKRMLNMKNIIKMKKNITKNKNLQDQIIALKATQKRMKERKTDSNFRNKNLKTILT